MSYSVLRQIRIVLLVLAAVAMAIPATAQMDFYTVTPCRVYDSRPGAPLAMWDLVPANEAAATYAVPVAGTCGIPADASAVAFNVTIIGASRSGFLQVFPTGTPRPTATPPDPAALSFTVGKTLGLFEMMPLGTGGQLSFLAQPNSLPAGTYHIAFDVFGYFLNNTILVDDQATVTEDAAATAINVLANDTDPDDTLLIAAATDPANGTVVLTGGSPGAHTGLTYQPDANYCNDPPGTTLDTFTYTVTTGSSATVEVTVTCVDDDPVAVDDAATVAEDATATTIDVLANDTDVDGGPISIMSVTQPANGTVVITNGGADLTYQPDAGYCNDGVPTDDFTYTLAPGGDTATVSVTVTCDDDPPTAVNDAATVTEDSSNNAIDVLANDTDTDGGPKSVASVTQPANGTVVITGGGTGVTYTPNANYCNNPPGTAPDTFTYTLNGGSTATVSVTVTCADDNPTAVDDAATVNEDSSNNAIDVLANDTDPDGGTKSVGSVTQPANGTVAITGGGTGVSYTPNANYCNNPPGTTPDTFTYTLNGGSTATVSVTVDCSDDNPTAVNDTATVNEDSGANTINVQANDTDPDGGTNTISGVTQPANGTVTITNGGADLTYAPNANYCNNPPGTTPDTFTYTLSPGGSTATVSVTVACLNDGPVIDLDANDDKGTAGSDFAVTFTEGDPATLLEDPVDATVTDIDNATLASLTVTITNLLDTGNETLSADVTGTSIIASYAPATGVLTLTGPDTLANFQTVLRKARYLNSDNAPDATPRVIQFVANDGTANGNTAVSTVTVVSVDTSPTAVNDSATVNEDSSNNAIDVLANDTDPDGGPMSIASVTQPANGAVVITGGGTGVSYTPNANYCNSVSGTPDTFTYTLTPGGSTATVSVTVTCVDDNPTAVNDSATVVEDSSNNAIDVLANDTDPDGGTKSVTSVTQPANGTVAITGGGTGVSYTPNPNYCNNPPGTTPDTFTYTLTPGGSTATVSVTVTCVDDPPVAVNDPATVNEDSGASAIPVLANDTDVDGGAISITSVTQPANGAVVITGGGTGLTYAPNANYCNNPPGTTPDTFTYTLTPGGSTATVSVTVTCINDPPVADADLFDYVGNTELRVDTGAVGTPHELETTPTTFGVIDGDSDPVEGDAISVSAITFGGCTDLSAPFDCTDPAVGTLHMEANGRFHFTPAPGDTGAAPTGCGAGAIDKETFQYTLTDNGTPSPASTTGTVTLCRFARVWYVDPTAGAGNGTSATPLNSLTTLNGAGGAGDSDAAGDYIFIYDGALAGSIELEANQRLIGEGHVAVTSPSNFALSIPVNLNGNGSPENLVPTGTRPQLTNASGDTVRVTQAIPVEIVGLNLASTSGNAIDLTSAAALSGSSTLTIGNNVIGGASAEGIDINLNAGTAGTLNLNFTNNSWNFAGTHTGNAVDINRAAGTLNLNFSGNTNIISTSNNAVVIASSALGGINITGFSSNSVHGNNAQAAISMSQVIFDSNLGMGGAQQVDGDTLAIGDSGNVVGGAGMALTTVQGNLFFDDLDIYANTSGLTLSGSGGMTFAVTPALPAGSGTSVIRANGGAAVDVSSVTLDLRLDDMDSTTTGSGVSLNTVAGTFSTDSDASILKSSGGGTAFSVASSVSGATVSYGGTLNVTSGAGVALTNNGGSTISFSGGMTLSTGANAGFSATGGGTVTVTDPPGLANNTITTTSGTALNVANTTIGASGLTFERISANGAANGIVLNSTGALGGLTVSGTGSTGSGGTIQSCTGDGISLTNTRNVNLSWMNVNGNANNGIFGSSVTNLTLSNLKIQNNTDALTEAGLKLTNLFGTNSVTNTEVSGSTEDNVNVTNNTNTSTLTSLTFSGAGCSIHDNSTGSGNVGINIQAAGTADMNGVLIDGCSFQGNRTVAIRGDAADTSQLEITIKNNVITAGSPNQGNQGIEVGAATGAQVTFFDIDNNKVGTNGVTNSPLINTGINVSAGGTASCSMTGHVRNNTVVNAGAGQSGFGIRVFQSSSCTIRANVTGNTVSNVGLDYGLLVESGGSSGSNGRVDAAVTSNNVSVLAGALDAIRAQARNASTMCARISNNTTNHPNDAGCDAGTTFCGLVIRQANTASFSLEGSGGSCPAGAQTAAQAESCVEGQNSEDTGEAFAATNFTGVASNFCTNIP